jgi:hypothetical protein
MRDGDRPPSSRLPASRHSATYRGCYEDRYERSWGEALSEALEVRAEILKLARLLDRDEATLVHLEEVPAADIRVLRAQITDVLFTAHGPALSRLVLASKLLPVSVAATIGERAFGPVLSARVAGLLEPDRAAEMAAKMPTEFLADVAVELDPRRASDVIGRIPAAEIADITRVLMSRGEYVAMGRFVGHLSDDAIAAAVDMLDDRSLLLVGFVLEDKDRLDDLIALLPSERLDGVIDAAAKHNLWPEVLDLLGNVSEARRAELAERAVAHGDGVLESLTAAARDLDQLEELERALQR